MDGGENPLYIRFFPFLLWLILLGIQFGIWLWIQNFGWHPDRLVRFRLAFLSSAVVAGVFLLAGLMIAITGWGIQPDIFFWGNPGVPLLAWQVWLSLGFGLILLTLMVSFPVFRMNQRRVDWIIGIGLCLLAVILWLQLPIPTQFLFSHLPALQLFRFFPIRMPDFMIMRLNL